MAIGVIWYPPVDQQTYDAVREKVLQAGAEKGMRFHAAGEAEGSWRIVEVWESRDGLERFMREDLHPAIDEVSGGQAPPPEPEVVFDVYFQGP
jgi:quinol monooxygenase YgiN